MYRIEGKTWKRRSKPRRPIGAAGSRASPYAKAPAVPTHLPAVIRLMQCQMGTQYVYVHAGLNSTPQICQMHVITVQSLVIDQIIKYTNYQTEVHSSTGVHEVVLEFVSTLKLVLPHDCAFKHLAIEDKRRYIHTQ